MMELHAFTCGKDPAEPGANEDQMVVVPGRAYAVVDGATDLGGGLYPARDGRMVKGGRLAAEAVAAALDRIGRESHGLPEAAAVAAGANAAIAAAYRRLGDAGPPDPAFRFRAAFAAAFERDGMLRLVALGDCGIRVDGRPRLAWTAVSDRVLGAARSLLWHALVEAGRDEPTASAIAFETISRGLAEPPPEPVTGEMLAALRRALARRADLPEEAEREAYLAAGLRGVRAAPERHGQRGVDGVAAPEGVESMDLPVRDGLVLELFSDGYEAPPPEHAITAWEEAQAEVHRADPWRVGRHEGTKGPLPGHNFDDRTVLIVRWGSPPAEAG